jgi:hypothetical protein
MAEKELLGLLQEKDLKETDRHLFPAIPDDLFDLCVEARKGNPSSLLRVVLNDALNEFIFILYYSYLLASCDVC